MDIGSPYFLMRRITLIFVVLGGFDCFALPPDTVFISSNFKDEYIATKCVHFFSKDPILQPLLLDKGVKINEKNHRLKTNQFNVLKTVISNNTDRDQTLLLFLHNVQIDEADLLLYQNNRLVYQSPLTGCTMPGNERPNYHRTLALPLILRHHAVYDMYIRVYRQEFGITVSPHLVDPVFGFDFRWTDVSFLIVISSCFFLSFLGMVMYYYGNLRKISQKDTLVFVIYSIITAMYVLAASGYGSLYIWGNYPFFEINAAIFFGALSGSVFMYLCRLILKVRKWNKWLAWWFDTISILYIVVSLLGFFMYDKMLPAGLLGTLLTILYLIVIINMVLIIGITVKKLIFDKEKNYFWFLFIFFFYIVYTIIVIALEIGAIRYNFEFHAIRIVSAHFPQLILLLIFLIKRMLWSIDSNISLITQMRKEITQDIHDEIGSTLTKISLQAHVSKMHFVSVPSQSQVFSRVEDFAVDANKKLRNFLVSISPKYDNLEYVVFSLKEIFLKKVNNIKHHFNERINAPKIILSNVFKNQIIQMFEELVSNLTATKNLSNIELFLYDFDSKELHFTFTLHYHDFASLDEINRILMPFHNQVKSMSAVRQNPHSIQIQFFLNLKTNRF